MADKDAHKLRQNVTAVAMHPVFGALGRKVRLSSAAKKRFRHGTHYLVRSGSHYILSVQDAGLFKYLMRKVGKTARASLDRKLEFDVEIKRNHPVQYSGKVFTGKTENEYVITPGFEMFKYQVIGDTRFGVIEGEGIGSIAGLGEDAAEEAAKCLYSKSESIRERVARLEGILDEHGRRIEPNQGLRLVCTFPYSCGDIGIVSALITGVRQATEADLCRTRYKANGANGSGF